MADREPRILSRRDVGKASLAATAGLLTTTQSSLVAAVTTKRKRYAIVGVGHRSNMYQEAINKTYADHSELVACCDTNPGRLTLAMNSAKQAGRNEPKGYAASDFDKMIAETKPEVVIVTTPDALHDRYLVRAMELGSDVITEKPMSTDAEKVQRILDARAKYGRKCRVTFNYRYTPVRAQLKELLLSNVIGEVLSVDFKWLLDTHHGADYFRRWHANKKNSGGLMVHKSTHHFDLVNWWLGAIPVSVFGSGKRDFYTPKMAKRLGLSGAHERCHTCPEKAKCSFEMSLAQDDYLKSLYLQNEQYDGYFRDRCVFRSDIDIEDTMNVVVKYDTGATLSYSLNAFASWEGYVVTFNGTQGRIEHRVEERTYLDPSAPGGIGQDGPYLRVYPLRKPAYRVAPRTGNGGHGGGDPLMLADLFLPKPAADKLLRAADERAGAWSAMVGICANESFVSGQTVRIADRIKGLTRPVYPAMPVAGAVPMPPKVARPPLG
jgi:predicted dehydrogenase